MKKNKMLTAVKKNLRPLCFCLGMFLFATQAAQANSNTIDLPACDFNAPGMTSGVSIGIAQPYAADSVTRYAVNLALANPQVKVCSESWSEVLPQLTPLSKHLERGHGGVAFVLAFLIVVAILYAKTPRKWWHRTTLVGVLSIGILTWVLGVLSLWLFHTMGGQRMLYNTAISLRLPQEANANWFNVSGARELEALLAERQLLGQNLGEVNPDSLSVTTPQSAAPNGSEPSGDYVVYHRLNLRASAGVQSQRITILNAGEIIQYDGARQEDWWRVKTKSGQVAWVSSLWLRNASEMPVKKTSTAPVEVKPANTADAKNSTTEVASQSTLVSGQ